MGANHPNLKTFYVEISRARDRAELVTGERIAALEAVEPERAKGREVGLGTGRSAGRDSGASVSQQLERTSGTEMEQSRAPKSIDRELAL